MKQYVYPQLLIAVLGLALAGSACRPSVDDNAEPVVVSSSGVVADGSITTAKLADGAVTTAKVAAGAITPEKLSQAYLPLAGGTMTGALNMGGKSLTNLATPSGSTDAVTKTYADSYVAGFGLDTSGLASISNGQALTWDSANSRWTPTTVVGGANATQIQGTNVDNTAPTANQAFYYNNGLSKWAAGTLPVGGGGTGATTLTAHGVLLGNGTSAITPTTVMTNGQLLIGQTGADPAPTTVTGDVTISNAGVTAIGANKVTAAMMANNTITSTQVANNTLGSTQVSATGGIATYSYASKTTAYTLTTSDNAIMADTSGGAFTLTLPAATTSGKVYTIKKTDSSVNAVTIARAGADTIEGATSIALNTLNESVQIVSDGISNWKVINRITDTSWTQYTMTIGASTTAPTKGTIVYDKAFWRREGDSMEIRYNYKQSALGTNGIGIYMFPIPTGFTIDTTKTTYAGVTAGGLTGGEYVEKCGTAAIWNNGGTGWYTGCVVYPYDATNMAITCGDGSGGFVNIGGGLNWGLGDWTGRGYTFDCKLPITGWGI